MNTHTITGKLVDLFKKEIYPAKIIIENGIITSIESTDNFDDQFIMPGFIDAHIHIESSMLVPTAFAPLAVVHGTVATVSDPHEIANVCGKEGVQYMIDNSKLSPFKFFFGAPSCVPATAFETAGAELDAQAVGELLQNPDIWYLSEVMNYPGVLYGDKEVMAKIEAAKQAGKPIDGHAPGLRGDVAAQYASAGITTDHECFTLDESLDKIKAGMHILIREGSAAKNYQALAELLKLHPDRVMFCSDDKHPDELVINHINELVKRSLKEGYDVYDVLRAACINPVMHYKLPVGLLRVGDPADFITVDNLEQLNIQKTCINGQLVAENGQSLLPEIAVMPINNFKAAKKNVIEFAVKGAKGQAIKIIECIEGQLITNKIEAIPNVINGLIESDTIQDILKIVVVNRYEQNAPVAIAFIKNFGLKTGALASTVAHDCHNIIAVGVDDASICAAVNQLIECKGGISVAKDANTVDFMPLQVGGLMSVDNGHKVAQDYIRIDRLAKELGTPLHAPFMTLSFMALLVIPSLKLSDKGLFDGSKFEFTSLQD